MAGRLPTWAIFFLLASLVTAQNAPTTMDADDDGVDDDDDDTLVATNCTRANPRVGLRAAFVDFEGKNISGVAGIRDDCSIVVRGFTYDGSGEDTVMVGANSREGLRNGTVFLALPTGKAWDGSELVEIVLEDGLSWSDFIIISCWDRKLAVDFGSVDLRTGYFPDDFFDYDYDDDDDDFRDFGDDDGDVDDDGVADADDPNFDDDGDIDDDGVPNVKDPDFIDDDGDADDDGVLNIDDPDFKDDDGDVDDDGVTDIDDDGVGDDDGDVDDDGVPDIDDDGVPDDGADDS